LYNKGLAYRSTSPTIWCPYCRTAIAHAELEDIQRGTEMVTIAFKDDDGQTIPIATTRPELLPACVAVFVNPDDVRYHHLIGRKVKSPVFGKEVPVMADPKADPQKGTGIVMCCTFGDTTDIKWWQEYHLPSLGIIGTDGLMNQKAGFMAGLDIKTARGKIIRELSSQNLVLEKHDLQQTVSAHDRCDTPAEYIETQQWFIRVLDNREQLLEAGRQINWHPGHMLSRYLDWVEHLEWDWCISRQRHHGVPFPLWYCSQCGQTHLAEAGDLPVDPRHTQPSLQCNCGSREFVPEASVMDTWATSSMSPQIAGHWQSQTGLFGRIFPMSLRPQAHDIVRTWAFYTIVMSLYHFGQIPWSDIAISGHGLSPEGNKVSKSKGKHIIEPLQVMGKYSADAVRYWAAGSRLGEDSMINEEKFAAGQRLVTKLWNVASFSYRFINGYIPPAVSPQLVPTDKWVLSRLQRLIIEVTQDFSEYDHANAKYKIESFFWDVFADNYLEMAKNRLYGLIDGNPDKESARYTLYHAIFTIIKMLAPLLPYITEEIFSSCFKRVDSGQSIHQVKWPQASMELIDTHAEAIGLALVDIATTARRFKSEKNFH
jgi:valyl-tRNA synthetase